MHSIPSLDRIEPVWFILISCDDVCCAVASGSALQQVDFRYFDCVSMVSVIKLSCSNRFISMLSTTKLSAAVVLKYFLSGIGVLCGSVSVWTWFW